MLKRNPQFMRNNSRAEELNDDSSVPARKQHSKDRILRTPEVVEKTQA